MSDPEHRVVQVSSIFEETPEGLARMDRIRRAQEDMERDSPLKEDAAREIDRRIEDAFLFGEGNEL